MGQEVLTATEAGYALGVTSVRVVQLVEQGRLKFIRQRPWLFAAAEVKRLAQQREKKRKRLAVA